MATTGKHHRKTPRLRWAQAHQPQLSSAKGPTMSITPSAGSIHLVIAGAGPAAQALVRRLTGSSTTSRQPGTAAFHGTITVLSNRDDCPDALLELAALPQVSMRFGQAASFIDVRRPHGHHHGGPRVPLRSAGHCHRLLPHVSRRSKAPRGALATPPSTTPNRSAPRSRTSPASWAVVRWGFWLAPVRQPARPRLCCVPAESGLSEPPCVQPLSCLPSPVRSCRPPGSFSRTGAA